MSNESAPKKFANPAPLGLAGFALTTWLLSIINVGWFDGGAMPMVLAVALAFGGTAQMIAGVMEMPSGNTFGTTAFLSYGAFWWSFALFLEFGHDKVPASFVGWYLFLWGVFSFYMWVATLKKPRALQLIFLALWITFFLLAHPRGGGELGLDRIELGHGEPPEKGSQRSLTGMPDASGMRRV